jgi:hypothetical protein
MTLQAGKPKIPPSKARKDVRERQAILEDADKTEGKAREISFTATAERLAAGDARF